MRFRPEQGSVFTFQDMPDAHGDLVLRIRTRWVDDGHEEPLPRELWLEGKLRADSMDEAISIATRCARLLVAIGAFCANVRSGIPEVHLAYDSTPGQDEHEFMEVFLPDETGMPSEGRLVEPDEYVQVFLALNASREAKRISRALHQYELALRHWYIGGEYLALSHLWMAVEALTKSYIRKACAEQGVDDASLARLNDIDPDDPQRPRWRPALEAWVRRALIFRGDQETYDAARQASDGIEHGFMELSDVHKRAGESAEATFTYVRLAIADLLGLTENDAPKLRDRAPRDVGSFRKIVRGKFIGARDDLAPEGEEYPHLEWRSKIRTATRTGDEFSFTLTEHFKVKCHPDISFQGEALEFRGRRDLDADPKQIDPIEPISIDTEPSNQSSEAYLSMLSQTLNFASDVANRVGAAGMNALQALSFWRFCMQVATFEAIHLLVRENRAPEAMVLVKTFVKNACLLQLMAIRDDQQGASIAIQTRLDGLSRMEELFGGPEIARKVEQESSRLTELAADLGIALPAALPDIAEAPFFAEVSKDFAFASEVAQGDIVATNLHVEMVDGSPAFKTQIARPDLEGGVAAHAVKGLLVSVAALAESCGVEFDRDAAQRLDGLADSFDTAAGESEVSPF
jgi:hypothetical protein